MEKWSQIYELLSNEAKSLIEANEIHDIASVIQAALQESQDQPSHDLFRGNQANSTILFHQSQLNHNQQLPINDDQEIKNKPTQQFPSSVYLGQIGEFKFEEIFNNSLDFRVTNTAKMGKHGDFIIEYSHNGKNYYCLVDIKNYTYSVATKEIDKFMDDLNSGNYDCGLFLSLKSRIVGYKDYLDTKDFVVPKGKVTCAFLSYVENNGRMNQTIIIKVLQYLFLNCTQQVKNDRMTSSFNNIKIAVSKSMEVRRTLSEMESFLLRQISRAKEELITMEVMINNSINTQQDDLIEEFLQLFRDNYEIKDDALSSNINIDSFKMILDKPNKIVTFIKNKHDLPKIIKSAASYNKSDKTYSASLSRLLIQKIKSVLEI